MTELMLKLPVCLPLCLFVRPSAGVSCNIVNPILVNDTVCVLFFFTILFQSNEITINLQILIITINLQILVITINLQIHYM
jgi:hypothetical protein